VIRSGRYEVDLGRARVPGAALLVGGLVLAHLPMSVGLPCPLRELTGVPCPFCGLTTSVRDACGGHVAAAVAAAPLGIVILMVALCGVLGALPKRLDLPLVAILIPLFAEWLFELHRYHLLF
jgi:hypothetical protein